jgi:hypothetical protein
MKFRDILNEMPHVEIVNGISIDLKKETQGKDWIIDVVPKIFKKYQSRQKEVIKNLMGNISFVNLFIFDFEGLPEHKKNVLRKKLPNEFWDKIWEYAYASKHSKNIGR